jgi:hypothetical protein
VYCAASRSTKGKENDQASIKDHSIALQYYEDVYLSAINKSAAADILDTITQRATQEHDHRIDLASSNNDLGVGRYATMPKAAVWALMGLPGMEQFPFSNPGDNGLPRIVPHTHQVAGVCIMLERFFTKFPGDRPTPTLLCDDVGLGKTYQIIGLIGVLIHLYDQYLKGAPLPPFAIRELSMSLPHKHGYF